MSCSKILVHKLPNGVLLPAVMLGAWQLEASDPSTTDSVVKALNCGYRGIDDAWVYHNEDIIGPLVAKFDGKITEPLPNQEDIKTTRTTEIITEKQFYENWQVPHGKPDDERKIFVTTKVWVSNFDEDKMKTQVEEHLKTFQRSSIDLLILHWPGTCPLFGDFHTEENIKKMNNDQYRAKTWQALERIYACKKARAIGISNYMVQHLAPLLEDIKKRQAAGDKNAVIPMYNQIEISPFAPVSAELVKLCEDNNILLAAYSPLGGYKNAQALLGCEVVAKLAEKYHKTPADIVTRAMMQKGFHVFPKSSKPERVVSNLDVTNFELSQEDVAALDTMNNGVRNCPDPHTIA